MQVTVLLPNETRYSWVSSSDLLSCFCVSRFRKLMQKSMRRVGRIQGMRPAVAGIAAAAANDAHEEVEQLGLEPPSCIVDVQFWPGDDEAPVCAVPLNRVWSSSGLTHLCHTDGVAARVLQRLTGGWHFWHMHCILVSLL